jgi:hypothetical protein
MVVKSLKEYIEGIQSVRNSFKSPKNILFRGQGNAEWKIKSTLERAGIREIPFAKYYEQIDYLKPEINSFGYHFERKIKPSGYDFDFSDWRKISIDQFPELDYLTYLRHHAFPTPLIDVTQSEYIALFFACENVKYGEDAEVREPNAKVFALLEDDIGNLGGTNQPELHKIGHYIETDPRHIAQQSEYILSAEFKSGERPEWFFIPFSQALEYEKEMDEIISEEGRVVPKKIYEIEIEGSAKKNILAELARMNINHYTLYLNEDALIQKLKYDFLRQRELIQNT